MRLPPSSEHSSPRIFPAHPEIRQVNGSPRGIDSRVQFHLASTSNTEDGYRGNRASLVLTALRAGRKPKYRAEPEVDAAPSAFLIDVSSLVLTGIPPNPGLPACCCWVTPG